MADSLSSPRARTRYVEPHSPAEARRVSWLMGVLFGLAGMGSSSAAVALPLVAEDLGVSVGNAAWTITLYTLMLAVTTAVYGRVSDLIGIRLPLMFGLGLMAAGALGAAFAPSFEVLLVARVFQGAGAAAVPVLGIAALSSRYEGSVRGLALGRLAGMAAAVSAIGPLVGGVVEHAFGWRAVMALPVLGVLVLPLVWRALTRTGNGARLDLVGAVLVVLTSGGMILLIQSPTSGLVVALLGLVLFAMCTPLLVAQVRRDPHGFLPLSVITNARVVRASVAAASVPASWFALLVGVPAVLVAAGWEPWQVGLLLLPCAVLALLVPRLSAYLMVRLGGVRTILLASAGSAGSLLLSALGTGTTAVLILMFSMLFTAAAFGIGQPALTATVGESVDTDVRGVALGVATLIFLVGGSVGSAVVAGLGSVVGIPWSLAALAVLPLLSMLVLLPEVRAER